MGTRKLRMGKREFINESGGLGAGGFEVVSIMESSLTGREPALGSNFLTGNSYLVSVKLSKKLFEAIKELAEEEGDTLPQTVRGLLLFSFLPQLVIEQAAALGLDHKPAELFEEISYLSGGLISYEQKLDSLLAECREVRLLEKKLLYLKEHMEQLRIEFAAKVNEVFDNMPQEGLAEFWSVVEDKRDQNSGGEQLDL